MQGMEFVCLFVCFIPLFVNPGCGFLAAIKLMLTLGAVALALRISPEHLLTDLDMVDSWVG